MDSQHHSARLLTFPGQHRANNRPARDIDQFRKEILHSMSWAALGFFLLGTATGLLLSS